MRVSPASFFLSLRAKRKIKSPGFFFLFYFIGGRPTGLIRRKIQKYLPSLNSPLPEKIFLYFPFFFFVKECPALYDVIRFGQKKTKPKGDGWILPMCSHKDTNSQTIEMCERKRRPRPTGSLFGDKFFSCTYNKPHRVCDISWSTPSSFFFCLSRELLLLYTPL